MKYTLRTARNVSAGDTFELPDGAQILGAEVNGVGTFSIIAVVPVVEVLTIEPKPKAARPKAKPATDLLGALEDSLKDGGGS